MQPAPCFTFSTASCGARFEALISVVLAAMLATGEGCDPRVIEAVELVTPPTEGGPATEGGFTTEGGPAPESGSMPEGGPNGESGAREGGGLEGGGVPDVSMPPDVAIDRGTGLDAACIPDAPNRPTYWPNCISSANSDSWLVQNHDALTVMRPRLLLLHFFNAWNVAQAEDWARLQIRALREGSRYHGYSDVNAPAFLEYEIAKTVDLTDQPPPPPSWPNRSSTRLPVTSSGEFDTAALFTQRFADGMGTQGFVDPSSSRNLTLCEIFERGLVNEAWLVVGEGPPRRPPLMLERKQTYDAAGNPIAGNFICIKGSTCVPEINCRTTVRMAHLDPTVGPGCDVEVRGWNVEHTRTAIPYVETNLRSFFNADFRSRFGSPFDSFDEICDRNNTQCVSYPNATQASGTRNGVAWTINPFLQGCGTPEFPPNARWRYDWANDGQVQSRCEHYGMRDGDGGQDQPDLYSYNKARPYQSAFGNPACGTGWQIYWRQSIPGFDNKAFDTEGRRMKNFWPFLFY
jgi:hypothetical protein